MYGPPPNCKKNRFDENSLRKCIRPLVENVLRAHDDDPRLRPERANHVWSYDFVKGITHDGQALRILVLIDEYTRECLVLRVARRLGSMQVIEALVDVMLVRGIPEHLISNRQGTSKWLERVEPELKRTKD